MWLQRNCCNLPERRIHHPRYPWCNNAHHFGRYACGRPADTPAVRLSEKTSPVFVVATANNIEMIPPEIIRKGRFDEVFFLNLPTKEERKEIFKVHLGKARQNRIEEFELTLLSELSKDFSGAEIEQAVIEAMRLGFSKGKEFNNEDILTSIQRLVPLARTKNKELNLLKEWFESGNVISASK